jgi:hypothetical protein
VTLLVANRDALLGEREIGLLVETQDLVLMGGWRSPQEQEISWVK